MNFRKVLLTSLFVILMGTTVFASNYKIEVKGQVVDTPIKVIDDRSLIGLRAVGEALGLEVHYDEEKSEVLLSNVYQGATNQLILQLKGGDFANASIVGDQDIYQYHRQGIVLEVSPAVIEGRVYVPIRFVCDIFGSPVDVEGKNIVIGDIFSSGLRTDRLNVKQDEIVDAIANKWEARGETLLNLLNSYDEDFRTIDLIAYDVDYYLDDLPTYAHFFLGQNGLDRAAEIEAYKPILNGYVMETKEGEKVKEVYLLFVTDMIDLYTQLGELGYMRPNKLNVFNNHQVNMKAAWQGLTRRYDSISRALDEYDFY